MVAVLSEPHDEDLHDTHCIIMRHTGTIKQQQKHCIGCSIATIRVTVLEHRYIVPINHLSHRFAPLLLSLVYIATNRLIVSWRGTVSTKQVCTPNDEGREGRFKYGFKINRGRMLPRVEWCQIECFSLQ